MGLFTFFNTPDINSGVSEFKSAAGAVLVDVRTALEYSQGHIEGSINIPLDKISDIKGRVKDKSAPVYVYCLSGARSGQAVSYLKKNGYTDVTNIGGISAYKGKAVK